MADGGKKPSFWETVPGFITAIAALITALATLITALYAAKIIGQQEEPAKKEAGKEQGDANKQQKDVPAENQVERKGSDELQDLYGEKMSGLFGQAMSSFKENDYKTAYKLFEQILSEQPNDEQAAKAHYLMGECLFNQNEYDLAILDYQKVISNYSNDQYAAAALLRQGMAFEKLTDSETANIIYQKVISKHPDSREAKSAKERMTDIQRNRNNAQTE